jgi:hypothetical protein
MLEGKSSAIGVTVIGSTISISESWPKKMLSEVKRENPRMLYLEPYGINVRKRGEGFWGNGGWSLLGGLLDEVSVGSSLIQLYAEIVEHHHSHFIVPFLFHRDEPIDTGYEFFCCTGHRASLGQRSSAPGRFCPMRLRHNNHWNQIGRTSKNEKKIYRDRFCVWRRKVSGGLTGFVA